MSQFPDAPRTTQNAPRDEDVVLVVDFGAQYAQLIARRVREAHVYSEIVPRTITAAEIKARRPAGVILSGGPASVYAPDAYRMDPEIVNAGVPILGICYGHQLLADIAGGRVSPTGTSEYGRTDVDVITGSHLLGDLPLGLEVWMSHGDCVTEPPPGFATTATSAGSPVAAMEDRERALYGVQFHPEVSHTVRGQEILKQFLYEVCGLAPSWTSLSIIEQAVDRIRAQIGDGKVVCGLSGGVDSAVAAALVHRAVGDQLTCIFVDHGLLRAGEADQVDETFRRHFQTNLIQVKAADRFLEKLAGVTDPETKRMVIGEMFIRVFEEVAGDLSDARFLVQGTLYPDVIESGSGTAATIKTHHNVGGLPADMKFSVSPRRLSGVSPSRVRAWRCESLERSRASDSKSSVRPTRSFSRRYGGRASIGRSGRPSGCCRRFGRSVSRVMVVPTPTRWFSGR
jgi:GMP synthase (glutamine-hydrolysing)